MKSFSHLKKNLKKEFSAFQSLKVALLGDTSTQFLSQAIRGEGYDHAFDLHIWEAGFNQVEHQICNPNSELYSFKPDVILIFQSSHHLLGKYNKSSPAHYGLLAAREMDAIRGFHQFIKESLQCRIILYNYTEIDDAIFGNYANKTESSFLFQLRKLNYELMVYAAAHPDIHLADLSSIQNHTGKVNFFHPPVYIQTEMVLSIDVLPGIASRTVDIFKAMYGRAKKCLVLDLDNTTWGGIIGDDGIQNIEVGTLGIGKAFSEFQQWVKKLKNRGIILAVCSKNTAEIAREPFEKHPDMVLKLEDIAVFIANWENKVDNLHEIRRILNIGFDSMVFLDDNPFERNMVREGIPEIQVPELPEDPAYYLEYLYGLNLFETASYSEEDAERTLLYQQEAQRTVVQHKFQNEDDFLSGLEMACTVESFNSFNIPRTAQLSQRSNQFNLRTIRYSEQDIERLAASADHFTLAFTLKDKFGNNGLICAIILQKEPENTLFIDTWFMSCRVLKRGMESFTLNTITDLAQQHGYTKLRGEYIPTLKNDLVKDHFLHLGFKKNGPYWDLELPDYKKRNTFIEQLNNL